MNIFGWSVVDHLEEKGARGIFSIETVDEIAKNQDIK
jgi:hypothetical protein